MDTKLKRFSRNPATKTIAFILLVLLFTAQVILVQYVYFQGLDFDSLFVEKYKDSMSFKQEAERALAFANDILENDPMHIEDVSFYYYVNNGERTWTNVRNAGREFFARYDTSFYEYSNRTWSSGKNANPQLVPDAYNIYDLPIYSTIYIAFPDSYMEWKQTAWENTSDRLIPFVIAFVAGIILELLLFTYLAAVAGRKYGDNELHASGFDAVYSDPQLAVIISVPFIWSKLILNAPYVDHVRQAQLNTAQIVSMAYVGLATAGAFAIAAFLLLSLIRKHKAHTFLRHSLIYLAGYFVYDFLKSLFDGRKFTNYPLTKSLFYRQLLFICSSFLLVLTTFLFVASGTFLYIVPPLLEAGLVYWYVKGSRKTFEEINKGFNESLEEQMKSERMKIALITNVSHDLKTPLTSIISYADLLSNEEGLTNTARDYVKILVDKSNRLKHTVSDLFDLAKSTSGNMTVEFERIDLKRLIEQTLADMGSDIEKSGLALKTRLPEAPCNITADGKKLYRVFQNVIDNALKYSLQGTRVYIELESRNGAAVATVKNTAGYEMDFTVEEIMQRFSRGDKSRTTEGSGLGLSIAESFTQVCGGDFKVDIDGDLFKVTIKFKLAPNPLPAMS